jgi:hypothetical protein
MDNQVNRGAQKYDTLTVNLNHLKQYWSAFVNDLTYYYDIPIEIYLAVGTEYHHNLDFEMSVILPDGGRFRQKHEVALHPFFRPSTGAQ